MRDRERKWWIANLCLGTVVLLIWLYCMMFPKSLPPNFQRAFATTPGRFSVPRSRNLNILCFTGLVLVVTSVKKLMQ